MRALGRMIGADAPILLCLFLQTESVDALISCLFLIKRNASLHRRTKTLAHQSEHRKNARIWIVFSNRLQELCICAAVRLFPLFDPGAVRIIVCSKIYKDNTRTKRAKIP